MAQTACQGQCDTPKRKKECRINFITGLTMQDETVQDSTLDTALIASVAAAISHDNGMKAVTFKMKERALQAVFWPGISTDIEAIQQGCNT